MHYVYFFSSVAEWCSWSWFALCTFQFVSEKDFLFSSNLGSSKVLQYVAFSFGLSLVLKGYLHSIAFNCTLYTAVTPTVESECERRAGLSRVGVGMPTSEDIWTTWSWGIFWHYVNTLFCCLFLNHFWMFSPKQKMAHTIYVQWHMLPCIFNHQWASNQTDGSWSLERPAKKNNPLLPNYLDHNSHPLCILAMHTLCTHSYSMQM